MIVPIPPPELFTPPEGGGPFRVLVLGSPDFRDSILADAAMDAAHAARPITLLLHAGAPGAELLAAEWAARNAVPVLALAAGEIPEAEVCIAFPGTLDTLEAVERIAQAGIPVWRPYGEGWREKPRREPLPKRNPRTRRR